MLYIIFKNIFLNILFKKNNNILNKILLWQEKQKFSSFCTFIF